MKRLLPCLLALAIPAVAQDKPQPPPVKVVPFLLAPSSDLYRPGSGLVMSCPSHKHGGLKQACAELAAAPTKADRKPRICWVCRLRLHETLPRIAPLVDTVVVNPFVYTREAVSAPTSYPWNLPHASLNEICELKALAGDTAIVGCLDLRGEPKLFGERQASVAEIEWMTLALVGSGYDGICWRKAASTPDATAHFLQSVGNLKHHADTLAQSLPTRLVTLSTPRVPFSCLASADRVFIVLLHPDLIHAGKAPGITVPMAIPTVQGTISLRLPAGITPKKAAILSGFRLNTHASETDHVWTIPFRFSTGGLMVVVNTKSEPVAPATIPTIPKEDK